MVRARYELLAVYCRLRTGELRTLANDDAHVGSSRRLLPGYSGRFDRAELLPRAETDIPNGYCDYGW